jgi:hypothetical protein
MTELPVSPIYGSDIRRLVDRAFSPAGELPRAVPPGGTIAERLQSWPVQRSGAFALRNAAVSLPQVPGLRLLNHAKYWVRALPHRLIVLGPLTEIACADIPAQEKLHAERRLIRVYERRYLRVPLPAEILDLLTSCAGEPGGADLVAWLDIARTVIMAAASVDAAMAARERLRHHALLKGAVGAWPERSVSAAELMTDVLVLCFAAHADLTAAVRAAEGGSVADSLAGMPEERSVFEAALPLLIRRVLTEGSFGEHERRLILDYARTRQPLRAPILRWPDDSGDAASDTQANRPRLHAPIVRSPGSTTAASAVDARAEYHRIVSELDRRILGTHAREVARRLALVGAGHLAGLRTQRVLLAGATGSGKTHAALALAEAVGEPYLIIDTSDITATGFLGGQIADVLDHLRDLTRSASVSGVLILDEIDKARADMTATGSSREAKLTLMHSLLALLSGQPVATNSGRDQIDTSRLLVIGTGAFDGRFRDRPPTTASLTRWGFIPEFAARWGERLCVPSPGRAQAIELLQRSERSVERTLNPLAAALQLRIVVPPEVAAYVADIWFRSGTDFRSASELLLTAARRRMVEALEADSTGDIVLTPDDVSFPSPPQAGEDEGDADDVPA